MVTAWYMTMLVTSDPLKQDLTLSLCRNQNIITLIETHINYNQIHHIHTYTPYSPILFSPGNSKCHSKWLLVLLHLGLEDIAEVEDITDPKGIFVSFRITPSNDRVVLASGNSWLRGVSLKEYKIKIKKERKKIKRKIKMREMKTNLYLKILFVL